MHSFVQVQGLIGGAKCHVEQQRTYACIDALAGDGTGYVLASSRNIQVVSPVENIIAMYDEAYH